MTDNGSSDVTDAKPMQGGVPSGSRFPPVPALGDGVPVLTADEFYSDYYKMDYPYRGKAIIINNKTFDRVLGLGERTGTDSDAIALDQRFSEMQFEVELHHNLTCKDMMQVMQKAANDDSYNSQSDCFVCAILSHGEEGVIYGVDSKMEVKQLFEYFKGTNCKGLIGKPKIFFIQACQGGQFDGGVNVNTTDAKGDMRMEQEIQVHKIPSEADFLIAYSVVPGYFSWRNSANTGDNKHFHLYI